MIVTMDGPAGAGKSSLARQLARVLGYEFLDTGSMYRAVTLHCLKQGIALSDEQAVAKAAAGLDLAFEGDRVSLNGEDVSAGIRTAEVTKAIRPVADNQQVRRRLVEIQRGWAGERDVVTEGRDQGTVAFPHAECKIYLTASPEERARRRVAQLAAQGVIADFEEILRLQTIRDDEDIQRSEGGLKAAADAIYVHTDGMSEAEVLARLVELVQSRSETTLTSPDPSHEGRR
jgi:cytidylate kinase